MATVNKIIEDGDYFTETIRECCSKCRNKDKSNLVCYGGKFCGKCPALMQGKSEPPKEYA